MKDRSSQPNAAVKSGWADAVSRSIHVRVMGRLGIAMLIVLGLSSGSAMAVPSFARKYQTSCQTCHVAFPKLNAFGRAFEANGFRFPAGQDMEMVKQDRLELGAEGYKKVFPRAVWPSDVSAFSPVSLVMVLRANGFENGDPWGFEFPHELELFATDTLGEKFSYFVEMAYDEGELVAGGFLQYDLSPAFHVRIGSINPQPIEFWEANRLTVAHFNYANVAPPDTDFELKEGSGGLEVRGAVNARSGKGGFRYRAGVVNGSGNTDNNNAKDYFAGVEYKIGGMGVTGGAQTAGSDKPWIDNSVTLGAWAYSGKETYDLGAGPYDDKVPCLSSPF